MSPSHVADEQRKELSSTQHKELICNLKMTVFYKMPTLHWDKPCSKGETEMTVSVIELKDGNNRRGRGDKGEPRTKSHVVSLPL